MTNIVLGKEIKGEEETKKNNEGDEIETKDQDHDIVVRERENEMKVNDNNNEGQGNARRTVNTTKSINDESDEITVQKQH